MPTIVELQLQTRPTTEARCFAIDWMSGRRSGRLVVEVNARVGDAAVAAELAALHELLTQRGIAGEHRTGRNLRIVVSRGATRKLLKGRSALADLVPFAAALRTRYSLAEVEVSAIRSDPTNSVPATSRTGVLVVDGPPVETIEVPGIGQLCISLQARQAYERAVHGCSDADTFKRLRRRLERSNWVRSSSSRRAGEPTLGRIHYTDRAGAFIALVEPATVIDVWFT